MVPISVWHLLAPISTYWHSFPDFPNLPETVTNGNKAVAYGNEWNERVVIPV